jgi:hypothetical protein
VDTVVLGIGWLNRTDFPEVEGGCPRTNGGPLPLAAARRPLGQIGSRHRSSERSG